MPSLAKGVLLRKTTYNMVTGLSFAFAKQLDNIAQGILCVLALANAFRDLCCFLKLRG
jgi:hypothetical protein